MFLAAEIGPSGYGWYLLQTVAVLAVICGAAWALVRFAGPRVRGSGTRTRMKILEKLPLEPRRSIYLVEVDRETVMVGVCEGRMQLLHKLPASTEAAPREQVP